jgi:hypothetical protein
MRCSSAKSAFKHCKARLLPLAQLNPVQVWTAAMLCCQIFVVMVTSHFSLGFSSLVIFLWIHTPRKMREFFLARYRLQKVKCHAIGAAILLPAKYQSPFLKGMQQLTRYNRGTNLFTDTSTNQPVKAKCDFVVWVDTPAPMPHTAHAATAAAASQPASSVAPEMQAEPDRPATTHTMQLLGSIQNHLARVLIDTGAEKHNYISAQFCVQHNIAVRKSKQTLNIAGIAGAVESTQSCCTATLKMQKLNTQLNFAVIDMPSAFDIILGDTWLKAMDATLDYKTKTCVVKGKGKRPIVLHMDTPEQASTQAHTLPAVLSYAQAKRFCKNDDVWHCLVIVKPAQSAEDAAVNATAVEQPTDPRVQRLQTEYPTVFTDHPPHGGSKLQLEYEVIPTEPGSAPVLRPMFRYSPLELRAREADQTSTRVRLHSAVTVTVRGTCPIRQKAQVH